MTKHYTDDEVAASRQHILDNFHSPDHRHATWWITPDSGARAVLDAVAPSIAARALREAASALPGFDGIRTHGDAARWLRDRADEIEAGR